MNLEKTSLLKKFINFDKSSFILKKYTKSENSSPIFEKNSQNWKKLIDFEGFINLKNTTFKLMESKMRKEREKGESEFKPAKQNQ